MLKPNGVLDIEHLAHEKPKGLLVLFDKGQDEIVQRIADVLGKPFVLVGSVEAAAVRSDLDIVGLQKDFVNDIHVIPDCCRTVVNSCAVDVQDQRDEDLAAFCDYEYIYTKTTLASYDVARFLGIVLGEIDVHKELRLRSRSNVLTMEISDVRKALADIDIISFGTDAIELRVDLLEDPSNKINGSPIPSLQYVGEQVSELRRATNLPIIFAIRGSQTGARFSIDKPMLCYTYLCKAIQWGCEYIEIEQWLPEHIRTRIVRKKGNSRIVSGFYDYTGMFRWSSSDAHRLFKECAMYGDVVKMAVKVDTIEDNYDLESFRAIVGSHFPDQPFCGINVASVGLPSLLFNKFFTPVSHHMLPSISDFNVPTLADINSQLQSLDLLESVEGYPIGRNYVDNVIPDLLEKCAHELGLSYNSRCNDTRFPELDTKKLPESHFGWNHVRSCLTYDFLPSAFVDRQAIIIGDGKDLSAYDATRCALKSLQIGTLHTIGFKPDKLFTATTKHIDGVDGLRDVDNPFIVISMLSSSQAAVSLLKFFSNGTENSSKRPKIFIDLCNSSRSPGLPLVVAEHMGWSTYSQRDVQAWRWAEMLSEKLTHTISYTFIKSQT